MNKQDIKVILVIVSYYDPKFKVLSQADVLINCKVLTIQTKSNTNREAARWVL